MLPPGTGDHRNRNRYAIDHGYIPGAIAFKGSLRCAQFVHDSVVRLQNLVQEGAAALRPSKPMQGTPTAMPSAPPVGIVVANHNNAAYVENAIDSVARQTVRDLSVVI